MTGTEKSVTLVTFAVLRSSTREPQRHHFQTTSRLCWVHLTSSAWSPRVSGPIFRQGFTAWPMRTLALFAYQQSDARFAPKHLIQSGTGNDLCAPSAL